MKSRIWAMFISALALSPLSVHAAPAPVPPPFSGFYQPQGVDEMGLWKENDESERSLAASNILIRDEKLTAYVKQVLCNSVGQDRCNAVRLYILRVPMFNASMTANGTMRVYTGLLLRVRSEAELGAVLAHEFAHFERRHVLAQFKASRSGTDLLAWAAVLSGFSSSYGVRSSYQNIELSVLGHLYRYQRDQEREADVLSIGYLNQSALRPQAAATMWRNVMEEQTASAKARGLPKPRFDRIAFTASHPPEAQRADYLTELAAPEAATRDDGGQRYRTAMAPWLPLFLDDQIKLNDFGASEYVINSLAENGWTAPLWFARGELYRGRGNPRDLTNAVESYRQALALDATYAEAYRGLGLSLMKTGQPTEGVSALRRYLSLRPDAADARMIAVILPKEGAMP